MKNTLKAVNLGDCRDALDQLPWYINGTLAETEAADVRAHLAQCAACRREAEMLSDISANLEEAGVEDAAAPFSELLRRINRRERQARNWKIAAGLAVMLAVVAGFTIPRVLLEPSYRTVTDALPAPATTMQFELVVATPVDFAALSQLLSRYSADLVVPPGADGRLVIEARIPRGTDADALAKKLGSESNVEAVMPMKERAQ